MPDPRELLGAMPGVGGPPGGGSSGNPMSELALSALGDMTPKSPNPSVSMRQDAHALDLAHKLVLTVIGHQWQRNPKLTKDLHKIGQQIQSAKIDLTKEPEISPPPDLMAGMGAGPMGLPPGLPMGGGGSFGP